MKQNTQYRVWSRVADNPDIPSAYIPMATRLEADRHRDYLENAGLVAWVQVVQN